MESHTEVSVLFEDPYWIVLIEDFFNGEYSVARQVIGTSEPTGSDLYMFFEKLEINSLKFTRSSTQNKEFGRKVSFKRRIREAKHIQDNPKVLHSYTKAHALLKKQREENGYEHKKTIKIQKEAVKDLKYLQRQKKRKEKHRGH